MLAYADFVETRVQAHPNPVNPFDLTGRRVLVTGASSGIGRETAVVLSRLGARVVISARRTSELEHTRSHMINGEHSLEPFDLAELNGISGWMRDVVARSGPLHGLVHAAGIRKTVALRGLSNASLEETLRVNLNSAVMLAKGFRQNGCCAPAGRIVFLGSVAALTGAPATAAYAASKAALFGLTRSLASELAAEGVRVNCIAAGMVESPMTEQIRHALSDQQFAALVAGYPLGLGHSWDVASTVAYLLSDAARWMTGQILVLDGGFSAQ